VYFIMAYVDGQTLGARIKWTNGPLPVGESRRILREVVSALAYAHAHRVIHRDIKPDNILISADGARVMVTDFGIARAVTAGTDSRLTATGVAIGTPAYMSPEQCAGDKEVDGRSDLYSVGVVGYQMLCGHLPFSGGNTATLLVKQLSEAPVPLRQRCPSVPEGLAAIIMRLLAKAPNDRFPNAETLELALADDGANPDRPAATGRASSASPSPVPPPARPLSGQLPRNPAPAVPVLSYAEPSPYQTLPPPPYAQGFVANIVRESLERAESRREVTLSRRAQKQMARAAKRGMIVDVDPRLAKIRQFRAQLVGTGGTMLFLTGLSLVTSPDYFWAIFPLLGLGLTLVGGAGRLWSNGISLTEVFSKQTHEALSRATRAALAGASPGLVSGVSSPAGLAPASVLEGPYGQSVRRAAIDRDRVHGLVAELDQKDKALVPNAEATADGLAEQVGALAAALHRIDIETPADQRPALADRRAALLGQLERAGILLQTLYLDLVRLRVSDAGSGADGVAGVTEQASALSRDIGYLLGAAAELRALDGRAR
jgi:serine/threonine-protein kinase